MSIRCLAGAQAITLLSRCVRNAFLRQSSWHFEHPVLQTQCCPVRHASSETLAKCAKISHEKAVEALELYKNLRFVNDNVIEEAEEMLKVIGIPNADISSYPNVLGIRATSIINYHKLLEECGFIKLSAGEIGHVKIVIRRSISKLKLYGYIPESLDVASHIIGHIPGLPDEVTVDIRSRVGIVDEQNTSLSELHRTIRLYYLCWLFNSDSVTIQSITDTYYRIKNRAICLIAEAVDMLITELDFTKGYILRHGYLLHAHPSVMRTTIQMVPSLGGIPIKEVVYKNPRLLLLSTSTLVNSQKLLADYGISNEAISRCLRVFTLSTETIRDRIVEMINDPFFSCLLQHPRFLFLILHNKLARHRMELLRQMNMKCYSLQLVSAASDSAFERFTSGREDRTNGGDALSYISQVLDCDKSNLRKAMNRHPHWYHIPLNVVHTTLMLLAKRGFYPEHIRKSVQILIYPTEHVERFLDSLHYTRPSDALDWSNRLRYKAVDGTEVGLFKPLCDEFCGNKYVENSENDINLNPSKEVKDDAEIEWQYVLPMCLYLLEKDYHFTGDGVWVLNKDDENEEVLASQA